MNDAGVRLSQFPDDEAGGLKPGRGREFYRLEEDCANLVTNDSGQRVCRLTHIHFFANKKNDPYSLGCNH